MVTHKRSRRTTSPPLRTAPNSPDLLAASTRGPDREHETAAGARLDLAVHPAPRRARHARAATSVYPIGQAVIERKRGQHDLSTSVTPRPNRTLAFDIVYLLGNPLRRYRQIDTGGSFTRQALYIERAHPPGVGFRPLPAWRGRRESPERAKKQSIDCSAHLFGGEVTRDRAMMLLR